MIERQQIVKGLVVVLFLILLFMYRGSENVRVLIIFAFYFLAALIYRIDTRYPVLAAIGSLVLLVILLAEHNETLANKIAIYAYYFIIVGVLLVLVDYVRVGKEEKFVHQRELKNKVLAIISGKGGIGKTTLTSNFAVALAKLKKRVIVINFDLAMPNLKIAKGVKVRGLIEKQQMVKGLVVVSFLALLFMYRGSENVRVVIVFAFYFLAALIYRIDTRYPVLAAIGSLVLAAILLAQHNEALANKVAIYAYYFLVVGVLLILVEYVREGKEEEFVPQRELKNKVLAITSGKGGVGKTTLASNLAVALAKLEKKVIVMDLDLAMPNLDIAMGVKVRGLGEALKDGKDVLIVHNHSCDILATLPIKDGYKNMGMLEKIKNIIDEVRQKYEVVVLDFPPGIEALDVIDKNTYVLIVANPEKLSIVDAYNVSETLEGRAKVLGVVINKSNGADVVAIEEMLSLPVLAVLPEENRVREALEAEIPLVARDDECEFTDEMAELVKFLVKYWENEESLENRKKD